jgi:hypothetical protein
MTSSNTVVTVASSEPRWHCDHGDGRQSIAISGYPTTVYIEGTATEIAVWASALLDQVRGAFTNTTT